MEFEDHLLMAKIAEESKLYKSVVDFMLPVFRAKKYLLSTQERTLLEKAWKALIDEKREAIRKIEAIEKDVEYAQHASALYLYRIKIKRELVQECRRAIRSINQVVLQDSALLSKIFEYEQENEKI